MIKMIAGVYGLPVKEKTRTRIMAMGPNSGPFSIAPEREAELVAKGVAVYVSETVPQVEDIVDDAPVAPEIPGTPELPELPELPEGVTAIPEYSVGMTAKELREIGALCGLTFRVGMSKEQMVAALDAHIEANMADDEDETEPEEGDEAPVFDASSAVVE